MQVAADGRAVGSLLIEYYFQKMRQGRCNKRRQKQVVADAATVGIFISAIRPPCDGQCTQKVLVAAPSQSFGNGLGRTVSMGCNGIRNCHID
jgi:hypothetical protein